VTNVGSAGGGYSGGWGWNWMPSSFWYVSSGFSSGHPMIGRLLGHTQVQTTARYAHLKTDPTKAAADTSVDAIAYLLLDACTRLPPFDPFSRLQFVTSTGMVGKGLKHPGSMLRRLGNSSSVAATSPHFTLESIYFLQQYRIGVRTQRLPHKGTHTFAVNSI
jgi:hypothetical protein